MMDHTIDELRAMSNADWQIVLAQADHLRGRHPLIIVPERRRSRPTGKVGTPRRPYTISEKVIERNRKASAARVSRQTKVVAMLARGLTARQIAIELGVSEALISKIRKGLR